MPTPLLSIAPSLRRPALRSVDDRPGSRSRPQPYTLCPNSRSYQPDSEHWRKGRFSLCPGLALCQSQPGLASNTEERVSSNFFSSIELSELRIKKDLRARFSGR